jgi:mono/diheme cytochrome c family protein
MSMFNSSRARTGRPFATILVVMGLLAADAATADPAGTAVQDASVQRGRYLVQIGGCNDCHTAGYAEKAGDVPESEWLTGLAVGFQGPWGTSYPANLRLALQAMSEDQWLSYARVPRMPPMPWFNLRDMSDADLRAMYRYIRSLGAAGELAPPNAPPGGRVRTPVIVFVPQVPEQVAHAAL